MNSLIKKAFESGRLCLLFGAGASVSSKDRYGRNLLVGEELSKLLATEAGMDYSKESLQIVYSGVKKTLGDRVRTIFEERYKHCNPSTDYIQIAKFPWCRIYTLNIDDAFDIALRRNSTQQVNVRYRNDFLVDQDQLFNDLDYVKLNGSIDRYQDGLIFSPKEYGSAASIQPLWYRELAQDFFKYTFMFIGSKLNEQLFYHQIERFRAESKLEDQRSYVLTPKITELEKASLLEMNLEHISGTLSDFVAWLNQNYTRPLTPLEIAINRRPEIGVMLSKTKPEDKEKFASTFNNVTLVSKETLSAKYLNKNGNGKIRNFYRGFKPDWDDILDGVPADLTDTKKMYQMLNDENNFYNKLFVVFGPAGSGKTTLLKQLAYKMSMERRCNVYFLEDITLSLKDLVRALDQANSEKYYIFYDRLDLISSELKEILSAGGLERGVFVGSERQSIWDERVRVQLGAFCNCKPLHLSFINEQDAREILKKLEMFGPWTRLSQMKVVDRVHELVNKAKRQLLIGLFEATSGIGFEKIIENEFQQFKSRNDRLFLILVGLGTIHRCYLTGAFIGRSLVNLGIEKSVNIFMEKMSGIVYSSGDKFYARHPVYIRHLFDSAIDGNEIYDAIEAFLKSYTVYEAPVIKKVGKNESIIFKSIINHRFLRDVLRGDKGLIIKTYETFEKSFENDGLFWLQYGLALRSFDDHYGALEKIMTSYDAYPSTHAGHALAQQKLIIACNTELKAKAFSLLDEAKIELEKLDNLLKSDDTYPIVTLAEGHTNVVRKFEGETKGREIAKYYANILDKRRQEYGFESRVGKTWKALSDYVLNGVWVSSEF